MLRGRWGALWGSWRRQHSREDPSLSVGSTPLSNPSVHTGTLHWGCTGRCCDQGLFIRSLTLPPSTGNSVTPKSASPANGGMRRHFASLLTDKGLAPTRNPRPRQVSQSSQPRACDNPVLPGAAPLRPSRRYLQQGHRPRGGARAPSGAAREPSPPPLAGYPRESSIDTRSENRPSASRIDTCQSCNNLCTSDPLLVLGEARFERRDTLLPSFVAQVDREA